jgi:hypothetical protein
MRDESRRQRAEARKARIILHKTRLANRERDLSPIRGAEALTLASQLTRESYRLAGIPEPQYARREIPCRFVPWPTK